MNDDTQAPETSAPQHLCAFKTFFKTPKGKLAALFVTALIVLGLLVGQVYSRPVTDGLVRTVTSIVPLPALLVDGQIVTFQDFLVEYDALLSYFQDQGGTTPPQEQLEAAIADTLVNKIAIQKLAKRYGVTLDEARVETYYQDILSAQESEDAFKENLEKAFGWTAEEFKKRIVESIVLALQMTDAVLADAQTQQLRRNLIDGAYARVQGGEDFATVAKDVHSGFEGIESDLGYVKASAIPESWAIQVTVLEEGQTTQIIELPEGYAIFKLEEEIVAGEDTQLHLLSITVPKVSLEEVVDEYLTTVKIKRYVAS